MRESLKKNHDMIISLPRKKKIIPRIFGVVILLLVTLMLTQGGAFRSIAGNSEGYFAVLATPVAGDDYMILFFDPDGSRTGHLGFKAEHNSYEICCFEENLLVRKNHSKGLLYDFYGNFLGETEYSGRIDNNRRIGSLFDPKAEYKKSAFGLKEYILLYRENGTVTVDISDSLAFTKLIILPAFAVVSISLVYYSAACRYYNSDEVQAQIIAAKASEENILENDRD